MDPFILVPAFDATPFPLLREAIDWEQRSVTVYGKTYPQPRLTRWYGPVPYRYSGLTWEAKPLPEAIQALLGRVRGATGHPFDCVLCNLYRDGQDTVGWHADDEPLFGPPGESVVASLSFGATRPFSLKPRPGAPGTPLSFPLAHGDLFVMPKGAQEVYLHSVPRVRAPTGPRINLTFRKVHQAPPPPPFHLL